MISSDLTSATAVPTKDHSVHGMGVDKPMGARIRQLLFGNTIIAMRTMITIKSANYIRTTRFSEIASGCKPSMRRSVLGTSRRTVHAEGEHDWRIRYHDARKS